MIYVLLITLIIFAIFTYFITNKDILSASFLSNLFFSLSTIVLILNKKKWGFYLSSKTFFVIVIAMICLALGELSVRSFFLNRKKKLSYKNTMGSTNFNNVYELDIPFSYNICISIVMVIYGYLYYYKIKQIASMFGNVVDFSTTLQYYNISSSTGYNVGIGYTFGFLVCNVLVNTYIYIILYKIIFNKFKKYDVYNFIPIVIFIIMQIITGSRSNFIYILTSTVVMGYILWKNKYGWKKRSNKKMIKTAILAMFGFLVIFYFSGKLTGKSQHFNDAFEGISVYSSGSIVSLNLFLQTFTFNQTDFGSETLYGISHILSRLTGKEVIETRHLEFIAINSYLRTNIYTSLRRYLHDYGYIGMCFIQFIMGMFYTSIYLKIKHHIYKNEIFAILIYSSIFYPIVMQSIDEKFLTILLTPTMLIQICCFYIFYRLFNSNSIK